MLTAYIYIFQLFAEIKKCQKNNGIRFLYSITKLNTFVQICQDSFFLTQILHTSSYSNATKLQNGEDIYSIWKLKIEKRMYNSNK